MIQKENHFAYYFFLITILILGMVAIWILGPNKNYQFIALIFLSMSYAVIGVFHHLLNHDLVGKIVIEYVLVAVLGIAAAFFIFRGGFGI